MDDIREDVAGESGTRKRRGVSRRWVVVGVALFLLVSVAGTLAFFGGPQRPPTSVLAEADTGATPPDEAPGGVDGAPVTPSGTQPPPGTSAEIDGAASGESAGEIPDMSGPAPEGGVEMPLIPIPGCKCHSDDPVVVEEHAQFTLSECMECH